MRRIIFCGLLVLICLPVLAQDADITHYTLFTGFDYMISPARNLTERGFESDFGVTARPWLGLGGDFGALGSRAGTLNGGETVFAPPGFGGIHETANIAFPPQLGLILTALKAPIPNAHQTDTTYFIGLGGGFDLNVSRKVGVRFAADWVNTHLFSNLLTGRQNYVRLSVGPTFRWGHLK